MKLLVAVWALCASGCLWANQSSEAVYAYEARAILDEHGAPRGAGAQTGGGYAGLTAEAEADLRSAERADDPRSYTALTFGFSLRASLLGILGTDHRLERYLDVGAEAGASAGVAIGVPPHGAAGTGSWWYGAWTELGTVSAGTGYLALTGHIRRESFGGPWNDQTQLLVGVTYRHRRTVTRDDLRWRD